jgi:CRP-like cAMP-binding protein
MAHSQIDTQNALVRKLNTYMPLATVEQQRLAELQTSPQRVKRGKQLMREGEAGHEEAYILQAGWACSFKDLPSGGRQIISFPIAGDFVGIRSILLKTADHSSETLTDSIVTSVDGAGMLQTFSEFPRLGAAILWAASRDEAMVVEHLVSIGRRNAIERTAHFFMELGERMLLVGLSAETEFECPLTQYVLADALGLSAIHVNRVLRELRELRLLTVQHGTVTIHDLQGLRKLSGFQGSYLH